MTMEDVKIFNAMEKVMTIDENNVTEGLNALTELVNLVGPDAEITFS